ncbi:MAG: hypothetical protein WCI06_09665 [Methylococcaceae bacterium]
MRNIKKWVMPFVVIFCLSQQATADELDNKISSECRILAFLAKSAKESLHTGISKETFIKNVDSFTKWEEHKSIASRETFLDLVEIVYSEGEYDIKTELEKLKSTSIPGADITLNNFKNASKEQQEISKAKMLPILIKYYSDGVYKNCMVETMKLLQQVKEQSQH